MLFLVEILAMIFELSGTICILLTSNIFAPDQRHHLMYGDSSKTITSTRPRNTNLIISGMVLISLGFCIQVFIKIYRSGIQKKHCCEEKKSV
jgi:hypothetical protein